MIVVPDRAMLEGMSTDPNDPVYVMWKHTPYAHIMVKVSGDEKSVRIGSVSGFLTYSNRHRQCA